MEIRDQAQADIFLQRCVAEIALVGGWDVTQLDQETLATAERFVRAQVGYFAGYYDDETRARVERLFKCSHPVFGSIETNGPASPAAAFRAGIELGKRLR
jgi:hypothetical protein